MKLLFEALTYRSPTQPLQTFDGADVWVLREQLGYS